MRGAQARCMAARGLSPSQCGTRSGKAEQNTCLRLASHKGHDGLRKLVANTDSRTPEEFRQLVVSRRPTTRAASVYVADVCRRDDYNTRCDFNGQTASNGIWCLPVRDCDSDVIHSVPRAQRRASECRGDGADDLHATRTYTAITRC